MKNFVGVVARFGLAAVWLYSGLIKLLNPLESRQAVQAYELLPSDLVPMVAVALPAFEVILGLLLVLGLFLRPVAALSRRGRAACRLTAVALVAVATTRTLTRFHI